MTMSDFSFMSCGFPPIPPFLIILVKPFICPSLFLKIEGGMNLRERSWPRHSRESGNPGRLTQGCCLRFLDARLRGHDSYEPLKIMWTKYRPAAQSRFDPNDTSLLCH